MRIAIIFGVEKAIAGGVNPTPICGLKVGSDFCVVVVGEDAFVGEKFAQRPRINCLVVRQLQRKSEDPVFGIVVTPAGVSELIIDGVTAQAIWITNFFGLHQVGLKCGCGRWRRLWRAPP